VYVSIFMCIAATTVILSVLMAIFPGEPGLVLLKLRMMEIVVTTGAMSCKVQSDRHHQQTNTQTFYRPDALPLLPNQQCQSTKEKLRDI